MNMYCYKWKFALIRAKQRYISTSLAARFAVALKKSSTMRPRSSRRRAGEGRTKEQRRTTSAHKADSSSRIKKEFDFTSLEAERMVLYKDDDVVVLNKPGGLAVHSGPKLNCCLSDFLHFWQDKNQHIPQLAHRLDKDTSGVILLTRHKEAARWVAEKFKQREVIKKYWAITVGVPHKVKGSVGGFISLRNVATPGATQAMNRMVLVDEGTKNEEALTHYEVLATLPSAPRRCSLIELQPVTGLKNQLRVHLAEALACPAAGDYKFGGRLLRMDTALTRKVKAMDLQKGHLYLHAKEIALPGYYGDHKAPLVVKAPLPGYFETATEKLGLRTR